MKSPEKIPDSITPAQEQGARPAIEETETHVSYLGETLEKATAPKSGFVPEREKIERFFVNDEYALKLQQKIATAMGLGQNLLIEGGTALGKTTTVAKMCAELGYELHYVNLNSQSDVENLMGRYIPNLHRKAETDPEYEFADGSVTSGMRQEEGKIKVILLDEVNATHPGVLKRLNEVLNAVEQDGTVVLTEDASEQIRVTKATTKVIALMNPSGQGYLGVNPLSKELINRFVYQKEPGELPRESFAFRRKAKRGIGPKTEVMPILSFSDTLESQLTMEQYNEIPGIDEIEARYEEFHFAAKNLLKEKKLAGDQTQLFLFDDQRESDRVTDYVLHHYRGDITETFQHALEFYYLNKLESQADRDKLSNLIKMVAVETEDKESKREGLVKKAAKKKEEEVATPEKKESMEGREPKKFLSDVFDWIESNKGWNGRNDWFWFITDKGIVNMKSNLPSSEFIDTSEDLGNLGNQTSSGSGIDDLLSELQGKKVISIDSNGSWYLRIVS